MSETKRPGSRKDRGHMWAREEAKRRKAAREMRRKGATRQTEHGISHETVQHRKKRHLQQAQIAILVVAIGIALVGWQLSKPAASEPHETCDIGALSTQATTASADGTATPLFACYRSLHFYLPVLPQDLTEIAFHQASGDIAQHIESLLPDADMTAVAQNRTSQRVLPSNEESNCAPAILTGSVLRMWRSNRRGAPDTAVDVGAPIGTEVRAPVTGRVVEIRPYQLYGEHDDFEIHIQPEGWPELDLVMIHVDDIVVAEGDHVIGGITPMARIRLLSDRVTPQLGQYVPGTGDHIHIQLNTVEVPGMLSTVGGS